MEENRTRTAHRDELSERSREQSALCSCGSEGEPRNRTQQGKSNASDLNPTRTEETLLSVVPESYSGHLPSLPSISLEDEVCSDSTQAPSSPTVSSEPQRKKIPVISKFDKFELLCSKTVCKLCCYFLFTGEFTTLICLCEKYVYRIIIQPVKLVLDLKPFQTSSNCTCPNQRISSSLFQNSLQFKIWFPSFTTLGHVKHDRRVVQ